MKKASVFIALFFSISFMFSQSYATSKVEYIIKNKENYDVRKVLESSHTKNLSAKLKNKTMKMMMEPGYFALYFNNEEAVYRQKDTVEKMEIDAPRIRLKSFLILFGGGSSIYYSNITEQQILVQNNSNLLEDIYLISYDYSNWKLLNETKKIGNYICYKAIKNSDSSNKKKQTVVWYTSQIPVRFGPKLHNAYQA